MITPDCSSHVFQQDFCSHCKRSANIKLFHVFLCNLCISSFKSSCSSHVFLANVYFYSKHSANRTDMHVSVFLFWNNGLLNYVTAQLKCTTLTVQKTQKGHARLF